MAQAEKATAPKAEEEDEATEKVFSALDDGDVHLLKSYGLGAYSEKIRTTEKEIEEHIKKVNELAGVRESETGLGETGHVGLCE